MNDWGDFEFSPETLVAAEIEAADAFQYSIEAVAAEWARSQAPMVELAAQQVEEARIAVEAARPGFLEQVIYGPGGRQAGLPGIVEPFKMVPIAAVAVKGIGIGEIIKPIAAIAGGVKVATVAEQLAQLGIAMAPTILGAVTGTGVPGVAGGGVSAIMGGTVVASGRGYVVIQSPAGRRITIQRKKHVRRYARRGGGGGMNFNRIMQMVMMKSMLKG